MSASALTREVRQINPTGKIPLSPSGKSPLRLRPSRPTEGRSRVVTNAGRDAVDARASGAQWQSQGEMNLVSDQLARETIGALADGKAVWFSHPLLVLNSRRLVGP